MKRLSKLEISNMEKTKTKEPKPKLHIKNCRQACFHPMIDNDGCEKEDFCHKYATGLHYDYCEDEVLRCKQCIADFGAGEE